MIKMQIARVFIAALFVFGLSIQLWAQESDKSRSIILEALQILEKQYEELMTVVKAQETKVAEMKAVIKAQEDKITEILHENHTLRELLEKQASQIKNLLDFLKVENERIMVKTTKSMELLTATGQTGSLGVIVDRRSLDRMPFHKWLYLKSQNNEKIYIYRRSGLILDGYPHQTITVQAYSGESGEQFLVIKGIPVFSTFFTTKENNLFLKVYYVEGYETERELLGGMVIFSN